MNRRKFLYSIFILSGGAAVSYYGYKFISNKSSIDLTELDRCKELIADLAELIIPVTDTPGAKDALVHEYIIKKITFSSSRKVQQVFIEGLSEINHMCIDDYGMSFSELEKQQQTFVLTYFQNKGRNFNGILGKIKNKVFGKSFFSILKEYTCIGYCTSMYGVTKGLAYSAIPSKYIACTNYTPGQKSWATK
jgi:hypothetical protein